jgi:hypothetical protein
MCIATATDSKNGPAEGAAIPFGDGAGRDLARVSANVSLRPGSAELSAEIFRTAPPDTSPGYYPIVCSIIDAAIAEIISAIDQLAADTQAGGAAPDIPARIAGIWAMLAALDPELARLSAGYERADG